MQEETAAKEKANGYEKPQRGSRKRPELAGMMEGRDKKEIPNVKGLIQSGPFYLPLFSSTAKK